jgi:PTH1 family peptidyl-tRNA hydrolase
MATGLRRQGGADAVDLLVVGLGNPGSGYARTRHNIGYMVVDALARRHGYKRLKRGFSGLYAAGEIAGRVVGLLQPTTFMNASGKSVAEALRKLKLERGALLVVHDEIDLTFGRLQLRNDGGHGGHNGLRSVHELVGKDFDRVRLGVGRPGTTDPDTVADYVLSMFDEPEGEVHALVERGADVVETWVREGLAGPLAPAGAQPVGLP